MTDSQRAMAARVVRVLACLISVYGILLLIDTARPENDSAGYVLLVLGPLFMLSARWVDPPASQPESPPEDLGDGAGAGETPAAAGQAPSSPETTSDDPE